MIESTPKIEQKNYKQAIKLLNDIESRELIRSINEKYYYWDKIKYQKTKPEYSNIDLWSAVKFSRTIDSKNLRFGNYSFSFTMTDVIQRILHQFDLYIGGNLGTKKLIREDDKNKYLISSIMEEAIASSQMEGAVTTRKRAKEMLRKNNRPRSKSEQMILNNYVTIQHIVKNKTDKLTTDNLLTIHKLITHNTLDNKDKEGTFRTTNDILVVNEIDSEVVHTPPDFGEISILINQLCDFFNHDDHAFFIHPIIKGIIIHFLIGYIHPFVDGNGRTARALFYWYLLSKGYWFTEYLSISRLIIKSKNQYEKAYLYTEHDDNDLTYFLNYNLKTMELAYESLGEYIQRKLDGKKSLVNFQKIEGINERQAEILKWYYDDGNLSLTVKELEIRFQVSNQTARSDLQKLVEKGFIEMIDENKKKKLFIKNAGFDELIKPVQHKTS